MAASQLLKSLEALAVASGDQGTSLHASIAAIIDATLSISRVPAKKLLDDLLRECITSSEGHVNGGGPSSKQEGAGRDAYGLRAFIGAAMHLLKKEGTTDLQLQRLISTVCLPALSARGNLPGATQAGIASSLADLIAARGAWALAQATLLPPCKASLSEPHTVTESSQSSLFLGTGDKSDASADVSDRLAPVVACHLASDLVRAALRASGVPSDDTVSSENRTGSELGAAGQHSARAFLNEAVSVILPVAFAMLSDGNSAVRRRLSISTLLPPLLEASAAFDTKITQLGALGVQKEGLVSVEEQLWRGCEELLARDRGQKADGFAAIACFKKRLLPAAGANGKGCVDARQRPAFWEAIKSGLLEDDSLIRRQALQVLRLALPTTPDGATSAETGPGTAGTSSREAHTKDGDRLKKEGASKSKNEVRKEWKDFYQSRKRDGYAEKEMASMVDSKGGGGEGVSRRWDAFLLLYENLDDYTLHLFEATWPAQIEVLHSGDHLPQPTPPTSPQTPDFSWVSILWQRGFQHRNPQVRQAVLTSFFDCQQNSATWIAQVPREFVLGPLWRALDDPVQHSGFGQKGVWSSPVASRAATLFQAFVTVLPPIERLPFLCELTRVALSGVISRPGLVTLATCLESAAPGGGKPLSLPTTAHSLLHPQNPENGSIGATKLLPENASQSQSLDEILDRLRAVAQETARFHNPGFRLAVCGRVLAAAAGVAKPPGFSVPSLAKLLAAFPDGLLGPTGPLRDALVTWVRPSLPLPNILGDDRFSSWLSPGLAIVLEEYFQPSAKAVSAVHRASEEQTSLDLVGDAGLADVTRGWEAAARQWAAVLALELLPSGDVAALLEVLEHRALDIYRRPYLPAGQAEKIFFLLQALLATCPPDASPPVATCPPDAPPRGSAPTASYFATNSAPQANGKASGGASLARHVSRIVSTCMDELTAYASKASAVLWEGAGMLAGIPGSQPNRPGVGPLGRGTLVFGGGPRALTGEAAAIVSRAVLSVRTISSCCVWLQSQRPSPLPESATNFLLAFLWHFVAFLRAHPSLPATPADAELWAAVLDALSGVCRAAAAVSAAEAKYKGRVVVVTEEHYDQPVEGFTKALSVVADDVADDVSRAAAHVLDFATLPRGMRGSVSEHKWLCLDALLSICASQPPPTPPPSSGKTSPPKAPRPFLTQGQLLDVLEDISDSLESAADAYLVPMLTCTRSLIELGVVRSAAEKRGTSEVEVLQSLVESAWAATADVRKRRVSVTSFMLATFLHPGLFSRADMHGTPDSPGPARWLLVKMLGLGEKAPRTIRAAAMQICGLWLRHPDIALRYVSEAVRMALHGSDAVEEELEEVLAEGQSGGGEYSALLRSRDPELTEMFHNSELYVRVSVAVMVHEMAHLAKASETDTDAADHYRKFGAALLMELLTLSVRDSAVSKNLYKQGSAVHRKKVRTWQMLCVLSPFLEYADVSALAPLLADAVAVQNMSSVRQYVEQFAVQVYLRFPEMVKDSLVPWLADVNTRTQTLASLVMIAAHVALHATPGRVQQEMLRALFPATLPYLTSHHHNLRTFTQVLVHRVLAKFRVELLGSRDDQYLNSIADYLENNVDCQKVRSSVDRAWEQYDPKTAVTPRGIFCPPRATDVAQSELPFECVPVALYDRVSFFIKEQRDALRAETAADMSALDAETANRGARSDGRSDATDADVADEEEEEGARAQRDFQRKIKGDTGALLPPETDLDEDLTLDYAEARARALLDLRGHRQDLIVVATLVARIPNLAGLARTCEVFKAAALVVADKSVVDDRQFQLISVSADKWVPLLEVPESALAAYLRRKQREGYSLVGLEQTANSVPLHQHQFPRKTVLVLGREKEGIPADIIHHLDACVEIPQLGVIRSLNVHVSGAIATWEYSRSRFQNS